MKGMILNVCPEGKPSFIGCVIGVRGDMNKLLKVTNLDNGETAEYWPDECELDTPIIQNVFDYSAAMER